MPKQPIESLTAAQQLAMRGYLAVPGLADSNTFAGPQSFSNQVELTGQTAANGTSAMTRDLVDARVGEVRRGLVTTDQGYTTGSATTLTSSTQGKVTLSVGTWDIEAWIMVAAGSQYATSGSKAGLSFSGTLGNYTGILSGGLNTQATIFPYCGGVSGGTDPIIGRYGGSGSVCVRITATITVTVQGDLVIMFGLNSNGSSTTVTLLTGSHIKAVKQ